MAAPPPVADNVPPQVTGVKVMYSNLQAHFRPLNEDGGETAPIDIDRHIISKNKINAAQPSAKTDTSVAIQDKTLYSKDQKVNGLLKQLGSYTSVTASHDEKEKLENKEKQSAGLGTLSGVYLPTIQNIFGVILFIRLPWIVGLAGIGWGLGIVGFCCLTTMLTAISMSAIATNGKIPAGGSYFMISRTLGPEMGGAVGMQFYLATTVASAMYILGAVEILINYIAPGMSLGSPETNARIYGTCFLILMCSVVFIGVKYVNASAIPFLAITLFAILSIFVGFFVSAAGPSNAVLCMYGDVLMDRPSDGLCNKLARNPSDSNVELANTPSELFKTLCGSNDYDPDTQGANYITQCNKDKPFLDQAPVYYRYGVPGLGNMKESWNWSPSWRKNNDAIDIPQLRTDKAKESTNFVTCKEANFVYEDFTSPMGNTFKQWYCGANDDKWEYMDKSSRETVITSIQGLTTDSQSLYPWSTENVTNSDNDGNFPESASFDTYDWVAADLTSTAMIMIGIFFPSVTGIMAGSNRSGDLADAPTAIPKGTIAAISTTSTSYLLAVIFFGLCCDGALLQDKFGESLAKEKGGGGELLTGLLCQWISPWVMIIGAFLSTCGAGLQSLTGAPRLLQSIARDDLMPGMDKLAQGRGPGNEPTYAVLVTFIISFCAIMIANLDLVAPILTIFFLMCYLFVNVSTTICSLMRAPSWRPSFKYYHWSTSLLGACCCLLLIFLTSVLYAIVAFLIAGGIYLAIARWGAKKEWGDAIKGMSMSIALQALGWYGNNVSSHTKNWRPQILLMNKLDDNKQIKYPQLLNFADSLKEGKGLLIIKTIIEDNFDDLMENDPQATLEIQKMVNEYVKAQDIKTIDTSTIVSEHPAKDVPMILQATGVSGLRPNTYCLNFPTVSGSRDYSFFYSTMRHAQGAGCSVLVTKNIENFPSSSKETIEDGTIDIWWIRLDGGMILLLAHLLMRRSTWRKNKLRIFVTAEAHDNSTLMESALKTYLNQMRINGEVHIVEVDSADIEPFPMNHAPSSASGSVTNVKGADYVMNNARKSMMVGSTQPKVDAIPDSHSGTWSASMTKMSKRATVIKKMHEASGLNKKIMEHSSNAELVLVNMPPIPDEHNAEKEANYMRFIEAMCKGLKRVILCRSTGNEVITMYN